MILETFRLQDSGDDVTIAELIREATDPRKRKYDGCRYTDFTLTNPFWGERGTFVPAERRYFIRMTRPDGSATIEECPPYKTDQEARSFFNDWTSCVWDADLPEAWYLQQFEPEEYFGDVDQDVA